MFNLQQYSAKIAVITDRGEKLTYAELYTKVEDFHEHIPVKGLIFFLCENQLGSLVGYMACIMKKIPAVLLDGSKELELIQQLITIYHPEYLWMPTHRKCEIGGKTLYEYGDFSLQQITYDHDFTTEEKILNPDLILCLTTSGSTGSPKLVRLSLKNLESNAESIAEYLQIDKNERPVTTLPMYYSFGVSVINSHLIKGATLLLTDKSVIQKEFWSFIKEQKATSIAGVPYTYEMLRRLRFFRMELPDLKTMTQAGGKLNATFVKEFVDFAKQSDKQFIVMYGQTEATARMSYLPWERALEKASSIGIAIPGGEFSLADASGNEILDTDIDGELVYKGANVSMGYAECREDLSKGDENHGILHTDDIARKDADGYYYITGRMKRFVKVWGNRCNLDATEQLVKAVTSNCACVGVDDKITVFVTEEGLEDQIKNLLVEKTGFNPRAFAIQVIAEIPKYTSGKIQYPELQKMI